MAMLLQRSGIFRDADQCRKTLLALNRQRSFSQFCDVVLRVCGTQIFAHSSVLAAASPYFSSFLGVGTDCPRAFSQKQPQVIEIHIDNVLITEGDGGYGEAVCKVVEFIYTSEITITTNLFSQIMEIGRIMLLDQLLLYCDEFQRGVNGNMPKTVSTCTSTLMEVVNLLSTSSKSRGMVDVQTETEETLFAKTSYHSSVISDTDTPSHVGTSQGKNDSKSKSESVASKELLQNDKFENDLKIQEKNTPNHPISPKESEVEEDFNTIKSFEDILEYDSVSVEQPSDIIEATENKSVGEKVDTNPPLLLPGNISGAVTSIELEDISDLVTFNSISSVSSKVKSRGAGRPRGRPRKRKRGRPKGRRDVDSNKDGDAASDYEFEELITKLEKGEHIEKQLNNDDISHERNSDLLQSSTSVVGKKSVRIKSRPSQLRNDYILHSLKRNTRKQYGPTINSRPSMQPVTKALEPVGNELKFVCQECDFTTSVFKDYVSHWSDHPKFDSRSYLCHKCGFKTKKPSQFKKHKEKHMAEELICDFCLFKAADVTEYTEHRLKHSGDFPYFCSFCDSRFKKKCQLESHKPKHWLQKPFVCPICKAGFKWKHALKNHMITHTTVKDHLCDICGYATAHKSMLTTHRLIHSGETFKCSVEGCDFEATKRQKLKMHMVTHTREKAHQCEVCGQRFSLAKNMRRHLLLHSNTRPIACKICSFTTTRYDKLKDHNLKMHNIGASVESKRIKEELLSPAADVTTPTVTIVTTENVTLNPDGSISAESLQKIAELAAAQQNSSQITRELSSEETMIKFEQSSPETNALPIITHIQYTDAAVEEPVEEPVQYLQEID